MCEEVGDGAEICRRNLAASDHDPTSREGRRPGRDRAVPPTRLTMDRSARRAAMYSSQLRYMRLAVDCQTFLTSFASCSVGKPAKYSGPRFAIAPRRKAVRI